MGLCQVENLLAILFTVYAVSFASTVEYEERAAREGWLRSEQEMKWLYEEWGVEHDKSYSEQGEKEKRFEIFKENLRFIDDHNRPENNHTSTVGLNQFADLTDEEFGALYLSAPINVSAEPSPPVTSRYAPKAGQVLPHTVDWRTWGAVSRVKNQGTCESCRAFAAVAAIEGLNKIVSGNMVTLSEQELVDCDQRNRGCQPGFIYYTYDYVVRNGGIDTDWRYPYTGVQGMCRRNRARAVKITSYETVPSYNEYALRRAVAYQPVSVIIEAHSRAFRFHRSGVFTGECGTRTDHFVTVIGYGREYNGIDYWLLKNSWGPSWGQGGIGKIQRNFGGAGKCGILIQSVYPVMRWWAPSDADGEGTRGSE
ncbi:hypothetical protein Taro_053677 [Colocasia esculenta]|uniref:Uncharacterized protein n=1 Tax=Colocasia esculenta TaxID=4460 RepID=A0A843XNA4_COLES|nr:hypothetical protein [Colocasia esculenta]